jgi:hypothetical protein
MEMCTITDPLTTKTLCAIEQEKTEAEEPHKASRRILTKQAEELNETRNCKKAYSRWN